MAEEPLPEEPSRVEFLKEAIKEIAGESPPERVAVATTEKLWRTEAAEETGVREWVKGVAEGGEQAELIVFHDWLSEDGGSWWKALQVASREADAGFTLRVVPRYGYVTESPSDLASELVGRMVRLRGMVTSVAGARAEVTWGRFECPRCGEAISVSAESPVVVGEVVRCPECGSQMVPTRDAVTGVMELDVQEPPEKAGLEADRIRVLLRWPAYRDSKPQPGDRVEVVGVPTPKVARGRIGEEGPVVLEAYGWFPVREEKEGGEEGEDAEGVTKEDVKALIAPELVGPAYDKIRELLVYQMISTDFEELRGRIHVLLVGPPASGKSRLLQSVAEIWGVYASAEHVTGPGLTVAAERSKGGWVLKAGAAVAADGMVLAVDELDKASEDDVNHMLELMESGKISVAKAGITAEIRSEPAVLAAANPSEKEVGRVLAAIEEDEEELSREAIIAEICGITAPLASRFDVVIPVAQVRDTEAIVSSLLSHVKRGGERKKAVRRARAWVRKAREAEPEIAVDERKAAEVIEEAKVPSDPRSVGAVIRVAVAAAKADYVDGRISSPKVKLGHVRRAAKLISELSLSLKELEKVTETVEKVELSVKELRELVRRKARELTEERGEFTAEELMEELKALVPASQLEKAREIFEDLREEGEVIEREPGRFRFVS